MMPDPLQIHNPPGENYSTDPDCLSLVVKENSEGSVTAHGEALKELKSVLISDPGLFYRLVYYALKNIRLYFASNSINGLTAQDVVHIVIEKIITGIRKWNRNLIPDIRILLFLSIKSFIRNEKRRKSNAPLLDIHELKSELNRSAFNIYCNELNRQDFHDRIFSADFEYVIQKLKSLLKNDIYASFVLDEILEGAESNIEIAENLNISVRDVENAKKRIRNKANKLNK
jgi:DNA-directed RNA polymerase specialized sigma24 family protein